MLASLSATPCPTRVRLVMHEWPDCLREGAPPRRRDRAHAAWSCAFRSPAGAGRLERPSRRKAVRGGYRNASAIAMATSTLRRRARPRCEDAPGRRRHRRLRTAAPLPAGHRLDSGKGASTHGEGEIVRGQRRATIRLCRSAPRWLSAEIQWRRGAGFTGCSAENGRRPFRSWSMSA